MSSVHRVALPTHKKGKPRIARLGFFAFVGTRFDILLGDSWFKELLPTACRNRNLIGTKVYFSVFLSIETGRISQIPLLALH